VLDEILANAAQEAGVELAPGTRMVDLITNQQGGGVGGVIATRGHGEISVKSRLVIGADGVWSRTAGLVGALAYQRHHPTNAVTYAYFEGVEEPGFWFQFTPGVSAGIIPTNDRLSCVFVGRGSDELGEFRAEPETGFIRLLERAGSDLSTRVKAARRVTGFRGTDGLPGFMRKPWGPGWALVGDSGYTKDPISAHGISDALRDAELCAIAVDRALRRPDQAIEAFLEYQRTRDRLSRPMFEESRALARYQWDADEASRRMRGISEAVRFECEVLASLGDRGTAISAA
jgi:flavin-dependent dehydrogenase